MAVREDSQKIDVGVMPVERVVRHPLAERLFHWTMAASVLTLLATAFVPILGWDFDWVTIHWTAGIVLTLAVLFHIVRAIFILDFWSMMVDRDDLRNAWRGVAYVALGAGPPPTKPGKYPLMQKLFHWGMAGWLLVLIASGLLMLAKLDTPFWQRDPYWLSEFTWGVVYTIHGYFALMTVALLMMHVYFAVRPDKIFLLRSMILGWVTRREYLDNHDPQRWQAKRVERN